LPLITHQAGAVHRPIPWWDWLQCQLQYSEARSVLGLVPEAEDPRLQLLRAGAFAGLGYHDAAVAEFGKALEFSPSDPQMLRELQQRVGYYHIHRREWKLSAAFARAATIGAGALASRVESLLGG
jgi:hypothetical protein